MPNYRRKPHFQVQREKRRLNKIEIQKKLLEFNNFLDSLGLSLCTNTPIKIEPKPLDDRIVDFSKFKIQISNNQTEAVDNILKTLTIADSTHLSQRSYIKLRKGLDLKNNLPPLSHLIIMKKSFQDAFELRINRNGCFLKYPLAKVELVIKKILENISRLNIIDDTLIIKLAGDGKQITKTRTEINNIVFTLINDKKNCKTSVGNYILGKLFF